VDLALGVAAGVDREPAGGEPDGECLAFAVGARFAEVLTAERFASGADCIDRVGLRAVTPRRATGTIELDHPLAALGKEPGEPGAVSVGAFDRPDTQPAVTVSEIHKALVAVRVGSSGGRFDHRGRRRRDDRGGVGVFVGVDADDDVDDFCQHGHCVSPLNVEREVPVRDGDRQDCDGTRQSSPGGQAPDQASHSGRGRGR
jgi:hypothetical protein